MLSVTAPLATQHRRMGFWNYNSSCRTFACPSPRPWVSTRSLAADESSQCVPAAVVQEPAEAAAGPAATVVPGHSVEARRQEVGGILQRLASSGRLPAEQLALALRLLPLLDPGYRGLGNLAGGLLVLLDRAEGGCLVLKDAAEALASVGVAASKSGVLYSFNYLKSQWEGSTEWRRVLRAPPLAALDILRRLADPDISYLAPSKLDTAAALLEDLGWGWRSTDTSAPALAVALLVVMGCTAREMPAMTVAAAAVRQAGAKEPHRAAILAALQKCNAHWKTSGAWQAALSRAEDGWDHRGAKLEAVFSRLFVAGRLSEGQLSTLRQLLPGLRGIKGRAEPMAGALLVVLARSEGRELSAMRAAAEVLGAGSAERGHRMYGMTGISFLVGRLGNVWQEDMEWQRLLGPPASPSVEVRLRAQLTDALRTLCNQGALPEGELQLACSLADAIQLRVHRYLKPGVLAGSVLVLVSAARGRHLGPAAAAAAVQAAGLEAGPLAIHYKLLKFREQWQASPDWQALLGPLVTPWPAPYSATPALLQNVRACLSQLATQGALPASEVPIAVELADSLLLHSSSTRASRRKAGNLVACLLVVLAAVKGRRQTVAAAAELVQGAGHGVTVTQVSRTLSRAQRHWQESAAWQELLGPPRVLTNT